MANTTVETGAVPAPKNLLARAVGIITSPRATYESVVAQPRWLGMLVLTCLATVVLTGGFMMTKVGQDAWLDTMLNNPSRPVAAQQAQVLEKIAPYLAYITTAYVIILAPIILVIVAAILYGIFNAALGGTATFKQVFAVVVHVGPVGVLSQLFTVPLNYARGTMTSAANVGTLLPMLTEGSFLAKFAGMVDLFLVWQLFVLAIGLAVLYRRKTQSIAITLFSIYAVIALAVAAFMSRGGTN